MTTPRLVTGEGWIQLSLQGEDTYGNVEYPRPIMFLVNFPPTVTASSPGAVSTGVPVQFPFSGYDRNGPPGWLRYAWQFDWEARSSTSS